MRSARKGFLRKFHYGLVSVSDGKCRPQSSRIKLCSDYITLQREEFHIWEDEDTYNVEAGLRTVELPRGEDGTLGISIKGRAGVQPSHPGVQGDQRVRQGQVTF